MHMHSSGIAAAASTSAAASTPRGASTPPVAPTLVFRTVLQGVAGVSWRNREVRIDEDSWLVLDGRETCSVRLDPEQRTRVLAVVVSPDDVLAAMTDADVLAGRAVTSGDARADARASPSGADAPPAPSGADAFLAASAAWPAVLALADNLRPRGGPAGRRLLAIAEGRAAARPVPEERQQRIALVREAWAEELMLRRRADRIDCVKPATREQLLRRILLAADFIASRHDEPIALDEMARAASLSRFHFVRLFSIVLGETPHAYLRRKRTAVARRHLAIGSACSEAASRAGFGSRSSLFRNLRKTAPADAATDPCFPSA